VSLSGDAEFSNDKESKGAIVNHGLYGIQGTKNMSNITMEKEKCLKLPYCDIGKYIFLRCHTNLFLHTHTHTKSIAAVKYGGGSIMLWGYFSSAGTGHLIKTGRMDGVKAWQTLQKKIKLRTWFICQLHYSVLIKSKYKVTSIVLAQ